MGKAGKVKRERVAASVPTPRAQGGAVLSGAAERLLAALGRGAVAAIPDPLDEGAVIVRDRGGSVSLGRGRHTAGALAELETADLVTRDKGGAILAPTGRARLARAAGGDDAFRRQHGALVREDIAEGGGAVLVNAAESPLAWLRRRRDRDGVAFIDAAAFEAGERLRRDLTLGGLLPSITARWDVGGSGGGGGRDPAAATDATIAARQRSRRALEIVGADLADLLVDLCGFLKGLEEIERDRGWPPRSGKVVVRLALARLADHYGLGNEARGRSGGVASRLWRAEPEPAPLGRAS